MALTQNGTTGADTLFANTAQAAVVYAKEGNDRVEQSWLESTLYGGAGNDTILLNSPNGAITEIYAGAGDDVINITGTLTTTLRASIGGNNAGNDMFDYNGAGASDIAGSLWGGDGNDTFTLSGGEAVALTVWGNSGQDNFRTEASITRSNIGMGQGNDSATFAFAATQALTNSTFQGGKGQDTLQFSAIGNVVSGTNIIAMGGGADVLSASWETGVISGTLTWRGDSGADTMTFTISGITGGGGAWNIYGDSGIDATAAHADQITLDLADTSMGISGTIAGGGGADTITFTGSDLTGNCAWAGAIDGGAGDDVIRIDGGQYRGTITGGAGADSIVYNWGSNSGLTLSAVATAGEGSGYFATIVGGAGNDTIVNTSFNTAGGDITAQFYITGLAMAIDGFVTGDVIQLLGVTNVNADANMAGSAAFTAAISGNYANVSNGAVFANHIALYQVGDDVMLQIVNTTGVASLCNTQSAARNAGVIKFLNNTTLLGDYSGGNLSNVGISFTQSLTGLTISFT